MIRVCISYPNRPGARFDEEYYLSKHMPMVAQRLAAHGMTGWSVDKGLGGFVPGTPPEHFMQARLDLESIEGLQAGMAAEGAAIMADIPNYTDIAPQVQIYQVLK
jgi:uncharacterized protein (TIGR02118 family)